MNAPRSPTPAYRSATTKLTTCAPRNVSTKSQAFSCHGESCFDSFQLDLLVGRTEHQPERDLDGQQPEAP